MRFSVKFLRFILAFLALYVTPSHANQTDTVSPIHPQDSLPYTIEIEKIALELPNGLHSGAFATYRGKWLFIAGRTNGLHGFGPGDNNFPPSKQNTTVYVVDPKRERVYSRSLEGSSSGLSAKEIDELSVTSPEFFQTEKTLYIAGGYGVDSATGEFGTKPVLSAIDIKGLMRWVVHHESHEKAAKYIRRTKSRTLQVTGGYMAPVDNSLNCLMVFGQNFKGFYNDNSNGEYTQQVRRFRIYDDGKTLIVRAKKSQKPRSSYRRRDLNVVPIVLHGDKAFVALSGVFTLDTGIWTVPVLIGHNGKARMADPSVPSTFKQGMNNYVSPSISLYSRSKKDNFILLLGGISYGYFENGQFETDSEIPFINQCTTVKIDKHNQFSQYLMDGEYPVILSTGSNPGNRLLFGAGAAFIQNGALPAYSNGVLQLDRLKQTVNLGYVVGGIMSTLANTETNSDSAASPYIFKIKLHKKS